MISLEDISRRGEGCWLYIPMSDAEFGSVE